MYPRDDRSETLVRLDTVCPDNTSLNTEREKNTIGGLAQAPVPESVWVGNWKFRLEKNTYRGRFASLGRGRPMRLRKLFSDARLYRASLYVTEVSAR